MAKLNAQARAFRILQLMTRMHVPEAHQERVHDVLWGLADEKLEAMQIQMDIDSAAMSKSLHKHLSPEEAKALFGE